MLKRCGPEPNRLLQFSVTGNATAKSNGRSEDLWQIYLSEEHRSTLDSFPRAALFQCLGTYIKKKSLLIMGTADAASSRKLKTGEAVKTQSFLPTDCSRYLLFHLTECQNVWGWDENMFPRAMSKRLFKISKEGDSTTSHSSFLIHKYPMLYKSVKSRNECEYYQCLLASINLHWRAAWHSPQHKLNNV